MRRGNVRPRSRRTTEPGRLSDALQRTLRDHRILCTAGSVELRDVLVRQAEARREFCSLVRFVREINRIGLRDLARRCAVTPKLLSRFELGHQWSDTLADTLVTYLAGADEQAPAAPNDAPDACREIDPLVRLLGVADVREALRSIQRFVSQSDYVAAHSAECDLYRDVLAAIAQGTCDQPARCAREALTPQLQRSRLLTPARARP